MKGKVLCCLIISFFGAYSVFSEENKTPSREAIQKELLDAETAFKDAQSMFNPWYTGPILAPSAHILPPGYVNIQPYLFITGNYGRYTNSGKCVSIPTLFNVNPQLPTIIGILDWMELIVVPQAQYNSQNHQSSFNFGDLGVSLGFGLIKEGPYVPALLLAIQETFPTGKYQKLNPNKGGVDATGAGSFATKLSLNFSKIVWWWLPSHPMCFRLSLGYTIPSMVRVKGFNAYGGGYGTDGRVHPGQSVSVDFGYEYSFTQNWAGALDVVYNYAAATHFSGHKGVNASNEPALVGGPFSEQLSLAPAIEYNWNENIGLITGVWFTVWGRNSLSFATGVLSVTITF